MGSLRNGAVRAKIVIWGAPGSGKTTTLHYVEAKLKNEQKGPIQKVMLRSPQGSYELLPVELGEVKGVKTQLDFIAAPGAWEHLAVRKRLLQGADGIVFVANSNGNAMKENQKALGELDEALKGFGRSLVTVPVVFEWMNQKAMGSTPPDELKAKLNRVGAPSFPVPTDDLAGVLKAFATISKMVVKNVRDEYDQGKLTEPAPMEIDLDSLPPKPAPGGKGADAAGGAEAPADGGVNPFADLANELDDMSEEFSTKLDAAEVDALLDDKGPVKAVAAATGGKGAAGRTNGAKFRLVSAGAPTLSPDGTLALPIRIGNDHGEEMAMTISVKVVPE